MADVLPFPTVRRADLVERTARRMAGMSAEDGDRLLLRFVQDEFARQERLGIACDDVEADLMKFALAVRSALWREIIYRPGGDGGCS